MIHPVPGARRPAPPPCWRFVPRSHRGCPETAPASAGSCCAYCPDTGPSASKNTHTHRHTREHLLCGSVIQKCISQHQSWTRTSSVSRPLASSSWTLSSARLRACSSACSRCFRVNWSQREASAIWEKAAWEHNNNNNSRILYTEIMRDRLTIFHVRL